MSRKPTFLPIGFLLIMLVVTISGVISPADAQEVHALLIILEMTKTSTTTSM